MVQKKDNNGDGNGLDFLGLSRTGTKTKPAPNPFQPTSIKPLNLLPELDRLKPAKPPAPPRHSESPAEHMRRQHGTPKANVTRPHPKATEPKTNKPVYGPPGKPAAMTEPTFEKNRAGDLTQFLDTYYRVNLQPNGTTDWSKLQERANLSDPKEKAAMDAGYTRYVKTLRTRYDGILADLNGRGAVKDGRLTSDYIKELQVKGQFTKSGLQFFEKMGFDVRGKNPGEIIAMLKSVTVQDYANRFARMHARDAAYKEMHQILGDTRAPDATQPLKITPVTYQDTSAQDGGSKIDLRKATISPLTPAPDESAAQGGTRFNLKDVSLRYVVPVFPGSPNTTIAGGIKLNWQHPKNDVYSKRGRELPVRDPLFDRKEFVNSLTPNPSNPAVVSRKDLYGPPS